MELYWLEIPEGDSIEALPLDWLSPLERNQVTNMRTEELRYRKASIKCIVREILADTLRCDPREIEFSFGKWGKPRLQGHRGSQVHFSVSHSQRQMLLGIHDEPVGVDIEQKRRKFSIEALISQILSTTEQNDFESVEENIRGDELYRVWVCKEAVLKALGLGLSQGLQGIELPLPLADRTSLTPALIDASLQLALEESADCRLNRLMLASSWQIFQMPLSRDIFAAVTLPKQQNAITEAPCDFSLNSRPDDEMAFVEATPVPNLQERVSEKILAHHCRWAN